MNVLLASLAFMEILKLQLLASYAYLALGRALERPLPFLPTSLAFFVSILVAQSLRRAGGLRVIVQYLAHLAAFAVCYLAVFALYANTGLSPDRLLSAMETETLAAVVALAVLGAFWLRGAWLEASPPSHEFVIARFDEGILEFLILLIMAAILRAENPMADLIVLPYFISSILALGISRIGSARKGGFQGRGRGAVLLSSAAAFALAAFGLIRLVPALGDPARRTVATLGAVATSFFSWIGDILAWLFKPRSWRPELRGDDAVHTQAPPPSGAEGGTSLFVTIVLWLVVALLVLVVLFLLALLVVSLVRYFSRRGPKAPARSRAPRRAGWLVSALKRLAEAWTAFLSRLARRRGFSLAQAAYSRLLACGKAGGVRRAANETPREFASRLCGRFPKAAAEAGLVVGILETEAYGLRTQPEAVLTALRGASARLSPLRFLAARLARRLSSGRKTAS